MTDTIADATPWLDSIKSEFANKVETAKNIAISNVGNIKSKLEKRMNAGIDNILSKIDSANPTDVYIDSSKFRTAIDTIKANAKNELSSIYATISNLMILYMDNINIDYNSALSKAYDEMNITISEATYKMKITDKDYANKYNKFNNEISEIVNKSNETIASTIKSLQIHVNSIYLNGVRSVQERIYNIITDRPLLRPTGELTIPDKLTLNAENEYGIELKNVGSKPWRGTIGITLIDQYKKTIEDNGENAPDVVIKPGSTVYIKRKIYVPKVVQTKNEQRNFGTNVTTKMYLITR